MAATDARSSVPVPVPVACRVRGLSTMRYYKWLKAPVCQRDYDDDYLLNVLHDLRADDAPLRYRLLTDQLADDHGNKDGENRVHRLCQIDGIAANHPDVLETRRCDTSEDLRLATVTWIGTKCNRQASPTGPRQAHPLRVRDDLDRRRSGLATASSECQPDRGSPREHARSNGVTTFPYLV